MLRYGAKVRKKIQIRGCVFTFSVKLEEWSFLTADLPRTGKKCFCFCSLDIPNV